MEINHDKFLKEWSNLQTYEEQIEALKNYMFSLSDDEFDNFLMWKFEGKLDNKPKNWKDED